MNQAKKLRENTRILESHLGNINQSDCCCQGISESQCFVLVEIGRKPNISVKELAEILKLDKSGISRTVEELVQKNYVERKASEEDRRYVVLNLTLDGKERFERIENDNLKVRIVDNTSKWMGVTYKEDKEELVNYINGLIEKGEYPTKI